MTSRIISVPSGSLLTATTSPLTSAGQIPMAITTATTSVLGMSALGATTSTIIMDVAGCPTTKQWRSYHLPTLIPMLIVLGTHMARISGARALRIQIRPTTFHLGTPFVPIAMPTINGAIQEDTVQRVTQMASSLPLMCIMAISPQHKTPTTTEVILRFSIWANRPPRIVRTCTITARMAQALQCLHRHRVHHPFHRLTRHLVVTESISHQRPRTGVIT